MPQRISPQASYAITVTPLNNAFANQIAFNAGGLPLRTSSIFNPPLVTPNANSATSTLAVSTTGGDAFVAGNTENSRRPFYALLLPFAGLILSSPAFRKCRSKKRWLLMFFLSVCSGLGLYGCTGVAGNFQNLSTPPGTYTVTITASSGSLQHWRSSHLLFSHDFSALPIVSCLTEMKENPCFQSKQNTCSSWAARSDC